MIKNVMVTGNLGYVGNVLVPMLVAQGYNVHGVDIGYYDTCKLTDTVQKLNKQTIKDIRDVEEDDFYGMDAVIHLAGLSNDPLGELDPKLTEEINLYGTVRTAELAKRAGVKRFVFASSQSMYGVSSLDTELSEDDSLKNPVTSYAYTKWEAEKALRNINGNGFTCVYFRPSTVFGVSPNLRCDIVYNNFIASAYTTGKIDIKSDGTPWRPVVHIRDVSSAFIAGLKAPIELIENRAFNVGIANGNYSVKELALAAHESISNSVLTFSGEHLDCRTYKVCFDRILNELKDYYQPEWNLELGAKEMVKFFDQIQFAEQDFKSSKCNRLTKLHELINGGKVTETLRLKR